ncbi:hypothetical protein F8388_024481 [Cannabis sativa]|uniref:Endonuclease/exonuclease/phosphatase domain-containing protein n=1 Tax=Cannabis sativa TaxID=3483 RepID=A0A7J6E3V6_CANSA|nr:hypothetical protein F8388_024481 [Cannabis sativa]
MIIQAWNIRGLNSPKRKRYLRLLLKDYHPNVLFLQETRLGGGSYTAICQKFSFTHGYEEPSCGLSGGLMLLWDSSVVISNITSNPHYIRCFLSSSDGVHSFTFCGPLLLTIGDLPEVGNSSFSRKRKRFRYEAMWSIDPECHQIVSSSWESTPTSSVTEVVLHNISSCAQSLGVHSTPLVLHNLIQFYFSDLLRLINEAGVWCSDGDDILNIIEQYYTTLFMTYCPADEDTEALINFTKSSMTHRRMFIVLLMVGLDISMSGIFVPDCIQFVLGV